MEDYKDTQLNRTSELLTELRIATSDEEMTLDKTEYSMDLLDSLRLSMEYIVY
jgi:hypothetical protein